CGPKERSGRDGTQAHYECRVDMGQFRLQPRTARFDVSDLWCRMYPPLATLGETEVLDRVGDVDVRSEPPRLIQRILQQPSGRTDKGNALPVFHVPRLLSDES